MEARRGEPDRPRRQHYEFVHVVLRAIAFRTGAYLLVMADTGRLAAQLRETWDKVGEDLPEAERIPSTGLAAGLYTYGSLRAAVIALPQARHSGEAYLAAYVLVEDPVFETREPEFFVLEHDVLPDGEPGTRVTRWTRDGRHLDLGPGPLPEIGAFLETVSRVHTIGS
ncbi:MAG: hypothetical protein GEV11_23860 [Streptosporangiales bacterium]|nr:hypothetical protein [Streptosporangiales bacterium]